MVRLFDNNAECGAFSLLHEMRTNGNARLACKSREYSLDGVLYPRIGCARAGKRHGKSHVDGQRSGLQIYARRPRHERQETLIHIRRPRERDSSNGGDEKESKTVCSFQVFLA